MKQERNVFNMFCKKKTIFIIILFITISLISIAFSILIINIFFKSSHLPSSYSQVASSVPITYDIDNMFTNTLSTYSSNYNANNINRSNNLELATSKLNNVIVLPNEIFSYNQTVGDRSIATGFKEASIYTSNGIETGIGGGVCQVSSTLYNAVLRANLDIVERRNHRYSVPYVPLGCDATVSYDSIDFKFKNTRSYPIKIQAFAKNGIVSVSILGIYENIEYDISVVNKKIYTIPFETKFTYDDTLSSGSRIVGQKGSYGYVVDTYKIVKLNGSVVSEIFISSDTYFPLTKIIRFRN